MILTILDELSKTSKVTAKKEILKKYQNNKTFNIVLNHALDPSFVYNIKQLPEVNESEHVSQMSLVDAIGELKKFETRELTGNLAKSHLHNILSKLSIDDRVVYARIIQKDLRCGVSAKTVNSAYNEEFIYVHPYNRSSAFNEKNVGNLEFPCYGQIKADGLYLDTIISGDGVQHLTRNGKELPLGMFNHLSQNIQDRVICGELVIKNKSGDGYMDREASNGIFNSDDYLSEYWDRITLLVWDVLTLSDFKNRKTPTVYKTRLSHLQQLLADTTEKNVEIITTEVLNDKEEAMDMYNRMVLKGEEGIIAKNFTHCWKDGTSKDSVKFKEIKEADLVVVGYRPGEVGTKTEHGIGSLVCQTSCGMLEVGVSGLSDTQRGIVGHRVGDGIVYGQSPGFDKDQYNGKIITVLFNGIIRNKENPNMFSLFLPRVKKNEAGDIVFRIDKDDADTLAELKEKKKGG